MDHRNNYKNLPADIAKLLEISDKMVRPATLLAEIEAVPTCADCLGSGKQDYFDENGASSEQYDCPTCNGTGNGK